MTGVQVEETFSGDASVDEARWYHEIARNWTPVSPEIRRVQFEFGDASDGTPAVWVSLVVPEDLNPSKDKIDRLVQSKDSLRRAIWAAGTKRWPYMKIATE
jgi:hypothetical protein